MIIKIMDIKSAHNLLEKARRQLDLGMTDDARVIIEELECLAMENADIAIGIANIYCDLNLIEESVTTIERAINNYTNNAVLFIELGKYQKYLGRFDDAIGSFRRAVDLEPENPRMYVNYANMLAAIGMPSEAIANYLIALEYNPEDVGSLMALASLQQAQGDVEGSKNSYRTLYMLGEDSAYITLNLVDALEKLGEYAEAVTILRDVISKEKESQNIKWRFKLADLLLSMGKHKEAFQENRLSIDVEPNSDFLMIQKATILERMGDYDEAFGAVRRYIESRDVKIEAALIFAKISPYLGMVDEAKKIINFIVAREGLEPLPKNIEKALEWLRESKKNI